MESSVHEETIFIPKKKNADIMIWYIWYCLSIPNEQIENRILRIRKIGAYKCVEGETRFLI